jgi:hypothetical protein
MEAEKHQQSGLPWAIPQSFGPPHSGQGFVLLIVHRPLQSSFSQSERAA